VSEELSEWGFLKLHRTKISGPLRSIAAEEITDYNKQSDKISPGRGTVEVVLLYSIYKTGFKKQCRNYRVTAFYINCL
jgi:hypothetical protein